MFMTIYRRTQFILIMIVISQFAYGQINYNQGVYVNPQIGITPSTIPLQQLQRTLDNLQSKYDQNKKYHDDLISWIIEMNSKKTDNQFNAALNRNYKKLLEMTDRNAYHRDDNELSYIKYDLDNEINFYNKRIEEAPKLLWESANNDMKSGLYNSAINKYDQLLQISPEYFYTYRNRGQCYAALGKYTLALNDLNKFIDKVQDDSYSYRIRGWIRYYLKDFTGAASDFNMQIELEPNADAYYNLGSAKSELGDRAGSITYFTKAIQIDPKFSMAYNNRGWAKFGMKLYSEAIKDFNKSIEIDGNNYIAYDSRQETKFAMNDFKGCLEDCNIALSLNPDLANTYFFRGRVFYKQGNKTKACEDWVRAGELGKSEAYDFIKKYCNH
jgi:tetratricopeptide (TPR) repeat protein